MSNFEFELNRKTFHIIGLLCPIIYFFTPKIIAVFITIFIAAFVVYIDIYRHRNLFIQRWTTFFLGKIMRPTELAAGKLASSSWMFIGMAISCFLFPKNATIFAWVILFVCDSVAAIIGTKFGSTQLANGKTLEGSFAFFFSTIILGMLYYLFVPGSFSFISLMLAALASTFVELHSKSYGIDDNLSIPIVAGFFLSVL